MQNDDIFLCFFKAFEYMMFYRLCSFLFIPDLQFCPVPYKLKQLVILIIFKRYIIWSPQQDINNLYDGGASWHENASHITGWL